MPGRARTRALTVAKVVLGVLAAVLLVWLGPPVYNELGESDVPTAEQANLPHGIVLSKAGQDCASGGCWATYEVDVARSVAANPRAIQELQARDEGCLPISVLDSRRVCAWIEGPVTGEVVLVMVQFKHYL